MDKIKVYCAFTGCGKTYFCKHHLGGIDLDEETEVKMHMPSNFMEFRISNYARCGYKIMTNASPYVFQGLLEKIDKYEIIVILPSPEMKAEILKRIYDRGDLSFYSNLCKIYDLIYRAILDFPIPSKKIGLKPGQYVSDIIEQLEIKQ